MTTTTNGTTIPINLIGTSCPLRVVAPAEMTPIARDLEAARTTPWMREHLAAQAARATTPEPTPPTPEPVTFGGHVIDAPGYSQDQFERAMGRAMVDELEIHTDDTGQAIVCHKGVNGGYRVTRTSCDCKAGIHGTPCKHRAAYLFHMQVRLPAVRKQWAKLQAERPGRKVVA